MNFSPAQYQEFSQGYIMASGCESHTLTTIDALRANLDTVRQYMAPPSDWYSIGQCWARLGFTCPNFSDMRAACISF